MADTEKLKSHIKGEARFIHYHDGALWYVCNDGFEFPVPVPGDVGSARFLATEKASLLMRYIRKHMEMLEKARAES